MALNEALVELGSESKPSVVGFVLIRHHNGNGIAFPRKSKLIFLYMRWVPGNDFYKLFDCKPLGDRSEREDEKRTQFERDRDRII